MLGTPRSGLVAAGDMAEPEAALGEEHIEEVSAEADRVAQVVRSKAVETGAELRARNLYQ